MKKSIYTFQVKPTGSEMTSESLGTFNTFEDAWDFAVLGELILDDITQTFQTKKGPSCWDKNGNLITRKPDVEPNAKHLRESFERCQDSLISNSIESMNDAIHDLRTQVTNKTISAMVIDMKERFPKRKIELMFGMGTWAIWVDDEFREPYLQKNEPLKWYYQILNDLDVNVWDGRGVHHNDVTIDPSVSNES